MKTITFWSDGAEDSSLLDQVLSGRKSVTCTPKAWYYDNPDEEPTAVGDLVAVLDGLGQRRGVIEITENYEIRFGDTDERIAAGELEDSVEAFKASHRYCWADDLAAAGTPLDDDTLMVVEHFLLVSRED